jgi:hypothetical protein
MIAYVVPDSGGDKPKTGPAGCGKAVLWTVPSRSRPGKMPQTRGLVSEPRADAGVRYFCFPGRNVQV